MAIYHMNKENEIMSASEALEIAKNYYKEHGNIEVGKIYEARNMYIVFGKSPNGVRYGSKGISISKDSGNINSFILPSVGNFKILSEATELFPGSSSASGKD